jgi:NADH-quinone oxidoreductase subunit H
LNAVDFLVIVVGLLALFTALSVVVLSLTWLERKFLGRLQRRLGPTRTGPMGILQPIADGLKLILKEDIIPSSSEKVIFWAAPILVLVPSFMLWVTIPASKSLVLRNLDLGLFFVIAFSVVTIVGLVMAGWGSANKYGSLGGLRAAAQLISYEIPVIMVVIAVAMVAQSMDIREIVIAQVPITDIELIPKNDVGIPFGVLMPLGLVVFLTAGLAEVGRTPFDIYFAESEIVGGPFVEYSGAHWSVFFLAEYMNTFMIAALTVLLFLGGWYGPYNPVSPEWLTNLMAIIWFLAKTYFVILVIFWVRGTFPRLRIDQLMAFAWKVLIPVSFINIAMAGLYMFYDLPSWSLTLMSLVLLAVVGYAVYWKYTIPAKRVKRMYGPTGRRPARAG